MKIAIGVLILWLIIVAFVWHKGGLSKGRKFGNEIARHLNIPKNLFHALLDNGVKGPSLQLLSMLRDANMSLERASIELGPSLQRGVIALEARYGNQDALEHVKPTIFKLAREWESLQDNLNA